MLWPRLAAPAKSPPEYKMTIPSSVVKRPLIFFACLLTAGLAFAGNDLQTRPADAVVWQGDIILTFSDIDDYVDNNIGSDHRIGFMDSPVRIEQLLQRMLLSEQMAADARKLGLLDITDVREAIAGGKDVTSVLAAAMRRFVRQDVEDSLPDFTELARERYMADPDLYREEGRIDVEHILIDLGEDEESSLQRAEQVRALAVVDPNSFEGLVEEYSDDPGKSTSKGYIEDAGSDQLGLEFRNAARDLTKPGQISPVFTDGEGHHILKLIARAPDSRKPFDEVKEEMIRPMRSRYINDRIAERIADYRAIPMEADPDKVMSLRTRYANAAATDADIDEQGDVETQ